MHMQIYIFYNPHTNSIIKQYFYPNITAEIEP